jgi:hypothetical protein
VTIGIRGPGDSFGEMALIAEGRKRSATVEAAVALTECGLRSTLVVCGLRRRTGATTERKTKICGE